MRVHALVPFQFRSAVHRKRFAVLTLAGVAISVSAMCMCIMSGWWLAAPPFGLLSLYSLSVWDAIKPRPAFRYQHLTSSNAKPLVRHLALDLVRDQGYLNQRQILQLSELSRKV